MPVPISERRKAEDALVCLEKVGSWQVKLYSSCPPELPLIPWKSDLHSLPSDPPPFSDPVSSSLVSLSIVEL